MGFHGVVAGIVTADPGEVRRTPGAAWLLGISAFWFATSYKWFLILVFLLPEQVARIVPGGEKSAYWGAVFGTGALWAVIGPALFGDMSDRRGDRRPYMLAGALLTVVALFVLFQATAIWMLAGGYLLLQISDDLATGPYSAVIPEQVPRESRGSASGIMSAAMSLSQVAAVMAVLLIGGGRLALYCSIGALNIVTGVLAVTLIGRGRSRNAESTPFFKGWLSPWKHADFRWVWMTRFLATLGFYLIIPYANFYIRDIVGSFRIFGLDLGSAERSTAVLALTMALAGAAAATASGPLIDRVGRKPLTYVSAATMAAGLIAMLTLPGMLWLWIFSIFVGAGYGAFQAANWAMVSDVLPEREGLGRDMGIWQMSISSVQIIAGGAGLLLTIGNRIQDGFGYQILFALAAFAVAAAGFVSEHVKGTR